MTKARDLSQSPNASFGFKNRLINSAMMIDQRNAGGSVTINTGANTYVIDRWSASASGGGALSVQRSTIAPAGFTNSLGISVSTVDSSIGSTDYYIFEQQIEGFNCADLGWGTTNAQTVTIGFWVRSSLTGLASGRLCNSALNRSYVFTYTVNSANTWEYKTVTIAGDTTGTWLTDNGRGMSVTFNLTSGSGLTTSTIGSWTAGNLHGASTQSLNLIGTNGATFYITGVQLEKGSTATSFDYRPYGTELALCERYFQRVSTTGSNQRIVSGVAYSSTEQYFLWSFQQKMRASPTVSIPSLGNVLKEGVAWYTPTSAFIISTAPDFANIGASLSSSAFSLNEFAWWGRNNNDLILMASAEL